VFKHWIGAEELESFFIQRCVFTNSLGARDNHESLQIDDSYQWQFRQDFTLEGKINAFEDKKRLSFSFGEIQVDIFSRVLENQTEVQLVQSAIPDTDEGRLLGHLNCRSCWTTATISETRTPNWSRQWKSALYP
jgi:hypothetical protein